jgi:hypothetical protein
MPLSGQMVLPYARAEVRQRPTLYVISAFWIWTVGVVGAIAHVSSVTSRGFVGGRWSFVAYYKRVHAAEQTSLRILAVAAALGLAFAILGWLQVAHARRFSCGGRSIGLTILIIVNAFSLVVSAAAIALDVPKLQEFSQ